MQQATLLPLPPPPPAPAPRPYRVGRYRLALVREDSAPFDPPEDEDRQLMNPEALARWLSARIFDSEPREVMVVVYLNARNRLLGWTAAYQGTLSRAAVEPRGILVPALLANAAAIVVAHNHPSGDPTPSAEDYAFTRRLSEAGAIVGVRLLDHVVVGTGSGRWVSLSRLGGWS